MRQLRTWFLRLWSLVRKERLERELTDELESHLQMHIADNLRSGMTPEEARRNALIKLGGLEQTREAYRDRLGVPALENLWRDTRYGLRTLAHHPGLTLTIVLTLALGIGANTAIFTVIDAVMLRLLPVKDPQQLAMAYWHAPTWPSGLHHHSGDCGPESLTGSCSFTYPLFEQMHSQRQVFSSVFGYAPLGFDDQNVTVGIDGQASRAYGQMVTGEFFSGLGVVPFLGRPIIEDDENPNAPHVAVISYRYWQRQFGGNGTALGKRISLNSVPFTIVGVTPPRFFGVEPGVTPDLWVPVLDLPTLAPWGGLREVPALRLARDDWWLKVMARLQPGVTPTQASAALDAVFQQVGVSSLTPSPRGAETPHIGFWPAAKGEPTLRQSQSGQLRLLMMVVALVLGIACANIASLLLARTAVRQREVAVRLSLGASRSRLIRQLLTESVLMGGLGGLLALVFADGGSRALLVLMSRGATLTFDLRLNLTVLAFTAVISVTTGILFGLAPAFRATRVDLAQAMKQTAINPFTQAHGARRGPGNPLVAAQVALSLLLLVGAGLFLRTLKNLEDQDFGFNTRQLLLFGLDPSQIGYQGPRLTNFCVAALRRVQALPGVIAATASRMPLLARWRSDSEVSIEGRPRHPNDSTDINGVGPNFAATMGMRFILGRDLQETDIQGARRVAVINEQMARTYFEAPNPIGRRFSFGTSFDPRASYEVVGVVRGAKYGNVREDYPPTVYVPITTGGGGLRGAVHFEVRTAGNPLALVPAIRQVVHELDPNLALMDVKTQTQQLEETLVNERLFAKLSSFLGFLGLLLAAIGLYGTMAHMVTRRTNEIGLRMALGAQRGQVLRMVLRQALQLTAVGLAIGLPLALLAAQVIRAELFGLTPNDPVTLVSAVLALTAVTGFAAYLPARRAARIDPMAALRME